MPSHRHQPGRVRLALSDLVYRAVRLAGAIGRPRLVGAERLPVGPAVYVANHAGSHGPISVVRAMPVRLHPWVIDEMLHLRTSVRRLYHDLGSQEWRLPERLGLAICAPIACLAVPFLRSLCPIEVHRTNGLFDGCYGASLTLLRQGRSILIFPEDGDAEPDATTGIGPFSTGFAWLCTRYLIEGASELPLVPLVYHAPTHSVHVLPPLLLHAADVSDGRTRRLCRQVEAIIYGAYRALNGAPDTAPPG